LEDLYFSTIECEDEPRKKKKGDLFSAAEGILRVHSNTRKMKQDRGNNELVKQKMKQEDTLKEEEIPAGVDGSVPCPSVASVEKGGSSSAEKKSGIDVIEKATKASTE